MDSRFWPSRGHEHGAALVLVLAFIVLLTGLVIAYLSRTVSDQKVAHGSFNQSKVDLVAASAMDLIIGGLRQEITGPSPTPTPPYLPATSANMLPMRFGNPSGAPDPIPNLIRRSVREDGLTGTNPIPSPGVPSLASAVNSTTAVSANGRFISLPRWNEHYLITRPAGADPTDTTPVSGTSGFTAPDWVILTRRGPVAFSTWNPALADKTPTNNSYAVGRYAYAIYDEGGLLDANVVGYPSNTTSAQYGPKGTAAFADLTATGIGISQGGIDAMVGWRNYFSASPSGTFPNFTFNGAAATRYVKFVLANTNGFVTVPIPSPAPSSRTDQQFPTRQSLIQLAASSGFTTITNSLQYLGTFSRELNAPSWGPTLDASDMGGNNGAGNVYAYKTNADSSSAINRNLLNVRVTNSFTTADGTPAVAGDALINRRFPLSRINGLVDPTFPVTAGNSTIVNGVLVPASATTVQRDFGLVWDGTNNRWNYVGASTTNAIQPRILTLDEVANGKVLDAAGAYTSTTVYREPNFFELLKAVILNGSLGMGSGSANTFVLAETKYYSTMSSDYQILQIGANIIDQWDSNNVPTFINFYDATGNYELAGTENLPYLNKLVFKPCWIRVAGRDQFAAWLLPSLWNPHQNAPPAAQNLRVAMTSGTMTAFITYTGGATPYASTAVTGSSTQYMTVDASSFLTISPSAPTSVVGSPPSSITKSPDNFYGFNFAFATNAAVTPSNSLTAYPDFGAGCNFEMQVQVGTTWKTYQRWRGCAQPATRLVCQSPPSWTATTLQDPEFVTLDPRTLRFGVWGNAANQSGVAADYTSGALTTLDLSVGSPPSSGVYETIPASTTALRPNGSMFASPTSANLYLYANNADGTVHYTDLDAVQRRGDVLTSGMTTAMQPADSIDRSLILNGAFPSGAFPNGGFQSVAELGHVFRDQPWRTLSFTTAVAGATANSADAGLLDAFTLHESSMEAGKTSLNTRQAPVLTAILSQATKRLTGVNPISSTERNDIVTALMNAQPITNKAELVTRLASDSHVTGLGNKEARECVIRALSDACQTRTWNLLIDVIAQAGRYKPNAGSLQNDFIVEGEQRYWVHVAIDRFTGQVIDKQIEVVNE